MTSISLAAAVNLTPHGIKIFDDSDKVVLEIPASGKIARVKYVVRAEISSKEGVPLAVGLPAFESIDWDGHDLESGRPVIVSQIVAALKSEALDAGAPKDLVMLYPDTDTQYVVRNMHGAIVGVKRMVVV